LFNVSLLTKNHYLIYQTIMIVPVTDSARLTREFTVNVSHKKRKASSPD